VPERRVSADQATTTPRLVAVLAVVAGVAVAVGGWSWSERGYEQPPVSPTADDSVASVRHGLDVDRAACTRFGLVVMRTETAIPSVALLGIDPKRRDFTARLPSEVSDLDGIAREYPGADYRLIDSVARVADRSALVLAPDSAASLRERVVARADAVNAAHSACRTIAGFDTHRLVPTENT
jgi:hypothetical protein